MATPTTLSIGVIICTTRIPRVCPQVANFVINTIHNNPSPPTTTLPSTTLTLIDLATFNLPMYNEPGIPSLITDPSNYTYPHTKLWSAEILKHSAFIFITPQYNWGYPAAIKNALDYLFHEWKGKPALVISYGGHGGGKAAVQLKQVLQGLDMRPTERMPALTFGSRQVMGMAAKGEEVVMGEGGIWEGEVEGIREAYGELVGLLGEKDV